MTDWPFGVGNTRFVPIHLQSDRTTQRGERLYFELKADGGIRALDVAHQLVGEVIDADAVARLRHTLDAKLNYVAEVANLTPTSGVLHTLVSWPARLVTATGKIQVVVNKKVRATLQERFLKDTPDLQIDAWLTETFRYQGAYLVFDQDPKQTDHLNLLGKAAQLRCEMRGAEFLWVLNAGRLPRDREAAFQRAGLLAGEVEWSASESHTPTAAKGALALLQAITAKSEYFEIWEKYGDLEKEMVLARAGELQPLPFRSIKYLDEVIRFFLEPGTNTGAWRENASGLSVELLIPPPASHRPRANAEEREQALPLGTLRRVMNDLVDIDRPDDNLGIPNRGLLRASAVGDTVRLGRQAAALERLRTGPLPIPALERLLTEGATEEIRSYSVPGFLTSPATLADSRPANDRQKLAVEMALNTPDICVIQGPPGTGKTSVIRTILRRLKDSGRNHLLVSSHQHTAVDNVLKGLQESGVVSYRFGGNSETENYRNDELEGWKQAVAEAVEANLRSLPTADPDYEKRLQLQRHSEAASQIESVPGALTFLHSTVTEYGDLIPESLRGQAQLLKTEIEIFQASQKPEPASAADRQKLTALVEALPERAVDLKDWLALNEVGLLLDRLARIGWGNRDSTAQYKKHLAEIRSARTRLEFGDAPATAAVDLEGAYAPARDYLNALLQTSSSPTPEAAQNDPTARALLDRFRTWRRELANAAEAFLTASRGHITAILKEWQRQIASRPARVKELFRKHADVWGVTCQQTVAGRFGLFDDEFDYVIVDEAARTGPLDLLIPLVRARKIILVGDHLQLPHALDFQIEKAFESAANRPEHQKLLKESIFERLYERLPASKKIRLNVQYRMHPQIGRMISQVFYAGDLQDDPDTIKLTNDTVIRPGQSLVWLNTTSANRRLEEGQFINQTEAKRAIEIVRRLTDSETPHSLGVITFYAQQRDLIERGLRDQVADWGRVQVGTVDAFQGEQKDIIVLSMVRSNQNKVIGFLNSPNRLNVALSRARRLLVILGDSTTVTTQPYLKAVFDYCQRINCVVSTL